VLFQAKPPMVDALNTLNGQISTHTDGKAYDRLLVSEAIAKGLNRLKLESVLIQTSRLLRECPSSLQLGSRGPCCLFCRGCSLVLHDGKEQSSRAGQHDPDENTEQKLFHINTLPH
jgi:hypothetical protein